MELAKMEPGELVYADAVFKFKINNKTYKKTLLKAIVSRKYDGDWPKLDKKRYSMIINKLVPKKQSELISDVEIIGLEVKARTGYINKPRKAGEKIQTAGFAVEKQTRLDNGTFV